MIYHCCDQLRRDQVAAHPLLNGVDYVEIIDRDLSEDDALRQRTLLLRFLKPISGISAKNLKLAGGERIRNLRIEWADVATPTPQQLSGPDEAGAAAVIALVPYPKNVLVIRTNAIGDFSTYRLQLVRAQDDSRPPEDFDPRLIEVEFSFKVEPSEIFLPSWSHVPKHESVGRRVRGGPLHVVTKRTLQSHLPHK